MSWDGFHKIHERQAKRAVRTFKTAMLRHFEQMMTAAKMNGFRNLNLTVTRVGDQYFKDAFKKVYREAGIVGAFMGYDELRTQKARRFINLPAGGAKDVRSEWIRALEGIALDESIPAIGAIMTTSQEIFINFVEQGIQGGETLENIMKALRKEFTEVAQWRAYNIARTETLSALNHGSEFGAQQTGYDYKRTWLTAMDGRERPAHKNVNGTSVEGFNSFYVDTEYMRFPGDPKASPGNRVNCRCTVVREVI